MSASDLSNNFEAAQQIYGLEAPFGLPDDALTIGWNVWARSHPKEKVFDHFIEVSNTLELPLNVYVDDLCARYVMRRTEQEQDVLNSVYQSFFEKRGIRQVYSSQELGSISVEKTVEISKQIKLCEFTSSILPEEKRTIGDLNMSELSHAVAQIAFLEAIASEQNVLLCGRFSQGVMNTAKQIIPNFPQIITVDKIS
jgi:hypothetical protein